MAHSNLTETSGSLTDLELETQKQKILEDIGYLAGRLNEYDIRAKKITDNSLELLALEGRILQAKKTLEDLSAAIILKQGERDSAIVSGLQFTDQVFSLREELEILEAKKSKAETEFNQFLQEYKDKSVEFAEKLKVLVSNTQEAETTLLDLAEKIAISKKQLEDGQVEKEKSENEILESVKKSQDALKQLAGLQEQVLETQGKVEKFQDILIELSKQTVLAKKQLVQVQDQIAQEKTGWEKDKQQQEEKLAKQEGELSIKESWLNEKEQTLKNVKAELEKFYNRPIKNVNF